MEPSKVQQKTPEQLIKVLSHMQEIFKENATKQELFELGKALAKLITEAQKKIDVKVGENKDTLAFETSQLSKALSEFETKINTLLAEGVTKLTSDTESSLNEMMSHIGYLEERCEHYDELENYDDSDIRENMESLLGSIPEEFDPKDIVEDIEELEEKVEQLEKKFDTVGRGTVGGVNNLRIRQALMDTIKTEQPVGDIDGINATYTVSDDIFVVLSIALNGETIAQLPNYTINGRTIVFSSPLPAVYSGKDFEVKYI